jgi:hypothetical protein
MSSLAIISEKMNAYGGKPEGKRPLEGGIKLIRISEN